jgi:transcription initiation factor TFIIF subunit alpha
MPAKSDPLALMFHSKKKSGSASGTSIPQKKQPLHSTSNAGTSQPTSQPASQPTSQPASQAKSSPFPSGPYQEWTLYSGITDEWRYDVMKFEHRKNVELEKWTQPVKLNRREVRRHGKDDGQEGPQAVGPMLGLDGKPVVGMDGRHIMIDAQGRPIHNSNGGGGGGGRSGGRGGRGGGGGKKFQKKTRQVFMVPDETRQLRKEERYPWVIEDATGTETWTAAMEEVSKSSTHAMFLPAANNSSFFFNTLHRWYKFQRKPNHDVLNLEEAEELVSERVEVPNKQY